MAAAQGALKMASAGHNLVIHGAPGTGKTTLIHKIVFQLRQLGKQVIYIVSQSRLYYLGSGVG